MINGEDWTGHDDCGMGLANLVYRVRVEMTEFVNHVRSEMIFSGFDYGDGHLPEMTYGARYLEWVKRRAALNFRFGGSYFDPRRR
jgi:hypothetical protein